MFISALSNSKETVNGIPALFLRQIFKLQRDPQKPVLSPRFQLKYCQIFLVSSNKTSEKNDFVAGYIKCSLNSPCSPPNPYSEILRKKACQVTKPAFLHSSPYPLLQAARKVQKEIQETIRAVMSAVPE